MPPRLIREPRRPRNLGSDKGQEINWKAKLK